MVNWESELKRFLAKKFNEITGGEISVENIKTVEIQVDLDVTLLTVKELGHIYVYAIMKEDFEHADSLANELTKRGCGVKIETDDIKKIGAIIVYQLSDINKILVNIPLKIYPDGMMVDFEKQDDF
jgi:hypothetical protein